MHVGQHPRGGRVGRQGNAMTKAQCAQLFTQTRFQTRPGAEQGKAGVHFQQQAARVMQADLRTETVSPGGEELLPALDQGQIIFSRREGTGHCLGGNQRLPGFQSERPRRRIDRLQDPALRRPAQQGQRCVGVGAVAQYTVQGQLWE